MALRLYLVRHGVTAWNAARRFQGQTDTPLNAEGFIQAECVSARLSRAKIDAVWSSDLSRATDTAAAIARPHGLPVVRTALFREIMFGDWEGLTAKDIADRGQGALWGDYVADSSVHRPPRSESLEKVWERVLQGLQRIVDTHPEGEVVLVGHGGALRVLLAEASGAPPEAMRGFTLDNGSVSLIEYSPGSARVLFVNDCTHLSLPEGGP